MLVGEVVDVLVIRIVAIDNIPEKRIAHVLDEVKRRTRSPRCSVGWSGRLEKEAGASEAGLGFLELGNVQRCDVESARLDARTCARK
jgi:hypothetical protein